MKRNMTIAILAIMLLITLAVAAYIYIDKSVAIYSLRDNNRIQATYLDTYDTLVCDLICGKTIEEANELLKPNKVVRFKQRQDLAKLHIRNVQIDLCLQGNVITAIESSPFYTEQSDCLRNINLFDGTTTGEKPGD